MTGSTNGPVLDDDGGLFAIASGKGGVGKTTTVINLGVGLRRAGRSVALVDADLGMANLGSMLGVAGEPTLHDVLAGDATVEEALIEEADGFGILTGREELAAYRDADPRRLGDVLEALGDGYDYVLVDTGAGMVHEEVLPLGLADGVVLVSSPDSAAVGDTRKTAELVELASGAVAGVVVTKAVSSTDARTVASRVGGELLGVIPDDPTVRESTTAGRPLELVDPDAPAVAAYRELGMAITGGSVGSPTGAAGDHQPPSSVDGVGRADEPLTDPQLEDLPMTTP